MSLLKSYAPSWLFPYRHPKPQGTVENLLHGLGTVFRSIGAGLDEIGVMVQGPAGHIEEKVQPNLAYAPVKHNPANPPTKGQVVAVPPLASRMCNLKEIVLPVKDDSVFIAPNANVLGDVKIGANSSIWYGVVLRGDVNSIEIGSNTNIQDNAVVHVAKHSIDGKHRNTTIGNNVTIGHCATIHACTIGDNCLVGMGATVLDGAKLEPGSIVAAGAIVPPNTVVPSGKIFAGSPARLLRDMLPEEKSFIAKSASNYNELANEHKFENSKTFEELYVEGCIESDRYALADGANSVHQMWEYDRQTSLVTRSKR